MSDQTSSEEEPKTKSKAKSKAVKAKGKGKVAKVAKTKGGGKPKGGNGIASEFGIRPDGERAKVLEALHKPLGRKHTAADLAKLTDDKSIAAVNAIVLRIEAKAKKYKLPFVVVRGEGRGEERTFSLQSK